MENASPSALRDGMKDLRVEEKAGDMMTSKGARGGGGKDSGWAESEIFIWLLRPTTRVRSDLSAAVLLGYNARPRTNSVSSLDSLPSAALSTSRPATLAERAAAAAAWRTAPKYHTASFFTSLCFRS